VNLLPEKCAGCNLELKGADPQPLRHQVIDIPPIKPTVTEYQLHRLSCSGCGHQTRASLPQGVTWSAFGPRLAAMLTICTAKYRLSKRAIKEMLSDFLGVKLALGSVARVERQVSSALAVPAQGAADFIKSAAVVHADETSWTQNKRKAWLWMAATPLVAVFFIAIGRGKEFAQRLLGESFSGILVSDRWSAYNWVNPHRRQLCWAHLNRDFTCWVETGGIPEKIGAELLDHVKQMFSWWHHVRDGTLSRKDFQERMQLPRVSMLALLTVASECSNTRAAGMAKHMLGLQDALWTFVDEENVEPTNNEGERTIRHAVMLRKLCFGTDSSDGSRFIERMLTTTATLRRQNRNVLEYVTAAVTAYRDGNDAPLLTPPGVSTPLAQAA
jgi:transposase